VAGVLRRQLAALQPEVAVADPADAHGTKLNAILGLSIHVESVRAKFKYGGNVDPAHRLAVAARLEQRGGPGDAGAAAHVHRRLEAGSGSGSTAWAGSGT
jgi:transcriptional regulator